MKRGTKNAFVCGLHYEWMVQGYHPNGTRHQKHAREGWGTPMMVSQVVRVGCAGRS